MMKISWQKAIASVVFGLGMFTVQTHQAQAESPETIPSELKATITEIEAAANSQDLDQLMEFYSANFVHSDGLTIDSMTSALQKTWETYPQLKYVTTIESWDKKGDQLVVETITRMNGSQNNQGRNVTLDSTVRSRQYFQEEKLVRQEILSEQTELKTGSQPPQIMAIAPETVKAGEQYNFDVIVTEPLEGKVLLGAALEEKTSGDRYLQPSSLELEPLASGGIYKLVTAPLLPDNNWLSAIIVRGDGITMITKRIRIEQ